MFHPVPLSEQLKKAETDPVRTLIIGAGVAGASLAALQRRRGRHPVLVERAAEHATAGYMIGALPLIGNLFHTLDRYDQYLDTSCAIDAYEVGDPRGRIVRRFGMNELFSISGDFRGIERDKLIDVLSGGGAVTYGMTVTTIEQTRGAVTVTFTDDTTAEFDVVVVADGIHSTTRSLVQPSTDLSSFDSGWGGWVVWAPLGAQAQSMYTEYWGSGRFAGTYPVKDRMGIFIGGPRRATKVGAKEFAAAFRAAGELSERLALALQSLEADPEPFYWAFSDFRSKHFVYGRVILLGDSAAGFLPTAGIGANMAMDSAAALDDELSRTGRDTVAFALELYERRQRDRVIAAPSNSRMLARLMFSKSKLKSWPIRTAMRWMSASAALGGIQKVMERR